MIILRKTIPTTRSFSKIVKKTKKVRDPLPKEFPIPDKWKGKYTSIKIDVQYGSQYNKDMKSIGEVQKKTIHNLISDIKAGFYYVDGPNGGDTHYLAKESKPSKYHRMIKSSNNFDRLNYNIYPPELDEKLGIVRIPIIIQSAKYHNIPGKGLYSDTNDSDFITLFL